VRLEFGFDLPVDGAAEKQIQKAAKQRHSVSNPKMNEILSGAPECLDSSVWQILTHRRIGMSSARCPSAQLVRRVR
jgi:hypothetical protein